MKGSLRTHRVLGWSGTTIALVDYGVFAAGWIAELWFFSLGTIASLPPA